MFRIKGKLPSYRKKRFRENLFKINFKSPVNTFNEKNDRVHCLLKDSKTKEKVCILVHGLGMRIGSKWDEALLYIPEEMGGCLIDLPYHRHRETHKDLLSAFYDGIFSLNFFRQGTLDIIRTVDILKDIGYKEVYIVGISLGSFFSLMAMALDERIKKGVLLLCGGDEGIITWKSLATVKIRKQHKKEGKGYAQCLKCRSFFPDFLESVKNGHTPDEIKSDVICFYFDPLSFAPLIEPERILMINALFDLFIPRESTIKLYKALGRPLIKWLPTGHLSLPLFKNKIISYIRSFLLYNQ